MNFSYPLTNLGVFLLFTISERFVPFWYKMSLISKADLTECNVNLLVVIQPNNTPSLPQLVLFRAIIYPLVWQKWHYSWPLEVLHPFDYIYHIYNGITHPIAGKLRVHNQDIQTKHADLNYLCYFFQWMWICDHVCLNSVTASHSAMNTGYILPCGGIFQHDRCDRFIAQHLTNYRISWRPIRLHNIL